MKRILILLCILLPTGLLAQEKKTSKPKVGFSGFIRNDIIVDSRQNHEALDGGYTLLPKKAEYDENGEDINAQGSVRFLNMMTRMRANVSGVEIWGGNLTGLIEVDAAAMSASGGTYELRLRHAFTKMEWERTSVILGQYWHPLFVEACFPIVINLNTGVPFQSFSRTPQLRVTHKLNDSFTFLGAASYQAQYENTGPDGYSSKYQRNAMVPNLDVQVSYKSEHLTVGGGYDFKMIQPYTATEGIGGTYKSTETLASNAFFAYFVANKGNWKLKGKALYGENMTDQLLPGGYAAYEVDLETGAEKFTNSNIVNAFIQPSYHKDNWTFGLFAGYMKNLGFDENPLAGYVYARTPDLDSAWRGSLNTAYKINGLQLMFEYEATTASYGTIDYADKGKVIDAEDVTNHRFTLSTCYFF